MGIKESSGHVLEVGDKVRMNIKVIEQGEMDGVEYTASGKNYWRYMNEHPDEVYTITRYDFENESCPYVLSGYMESPGGNWSSDELIHVPEAVSRFEVIKNMTLEEMAKSLIPMVQILLESGSKTEQDIQHWLSSAPEN